LAQWRPFGLAGVPPRRARIDRRAAGAGAVLRHVRGNPQLAAAGAKQQVITAVGRELLGFIWAIGVAAERSQSDPRGRALKRAA